MIPPLYPRDVSSWFALFKRHLSGSGFSLEQPGEPVYTLAQLFAEMMAESARLLGQTPEKHRLAFLNALQLPRRKAEAAEGFAVFQLSEGCEQSVTLPRGTLLAAEQEEGPLLFQTAEEFQAHPIRLEEVWWSDPDSDTAECVFQADSGHPLSPFSPGQKTGQTSFSSPHRLEMAVPEVFCNRGSHHHRVTFSALLRLEQAELGLDILADPDCFGWGIRLLGENRSIPLAVSRHPSGKLALDVMNCPIDLSTVWVQLELRDPAFLSIQLEQPRFFSEGNEIPPSRICFGDHQQNPESFYPFQNPLQPYEQCLVFSDEGLFHPGAELTLTFDLELECQEEREPELPETVDYRWIMRKPLPKPEPVILRAYAQEVMLEYWNGSRFAPVAGGNLGVFSEKRVQFSLKFFCPPDLAPQEEGYCLRLSCGGCPAIYSLPRRVYTPRIDHLRFAYASLNPAEPIELKAWNFGERIELPVEGPIQPFHRPPGEARSIYLGFDTLPSSAWLQFLIQAEPQDSQPPETLSCELPDGRGLLLQDGTRGLTQSGLIACHIPEKPAPSEHFGSRRYWLHFRIPARSPRWIQQIFLNAGSIRNLLLFEELFPLDRIPRGGPITLEKGGLSEIRVAVRQSGKWIPWKEYQPQEGRFREGFFQADADRGQVFLPPDFFTLFPAVQTDDVLRVEYAVTDGEKGNLPAGSITSIRTEIPFITGVFNPLPTLNGGSGEPDKALALRSEHWLHHAGRAVTPRDYELLAADLCPLVRQARCLPGNPIRLVLYLDSSQAVFPQVRQNLSEKLGACGAAAQYGIPLEILPAKRVPLRVQIKADEDPAISPATLQTRLKYLIADYLHPAHGWTIGKLPSEPLLAQRLEALIGQHSPELELPNPHSLRISCTWMEPLSPLDLPGDFQLELGLV